MTPKKLPKLDSTQGQRKLSIFFNMELNAKSAKADREHKNKDATIKFEGQGPPCEASSTLSRPANKLHKDRKFQSKWLTLWPCLVFEIDAIFCKICLKHNNKKK